MKVAVLGNGQLGSMLQQAGLRIGIAVDLLDIEQTEQACLPAPDVPITAEREHWPVNAFTQALQHHPGWLNTAAFASLTNRITQKTLIDHLGLPTAPWCVFPAGLPPAQLREQLHQTLGPDIFLKRAMGGYDGKGQQRLKVGCEKALPAWGNAAIAEQAMNFDTEVSIFGARGRDGQVVYYSLTENRHDEGVLTISLSLLSHWDALQAQAETMLHRVMQALDYVGVMAMECFVLNGQLFINEIAPRVHNSGHWTQAGASISQFEMHLRAVCGLPMPQPWQTASCMMINLLGLPYNPAWLQQGAAQLHWYGKSWQAGRKMGHLNFCHSDPKQLAQWLMAVEMPASFNGARDWALHRLSAPR